MYKTLSREIDGSSGLIDKSLIYKYAKTEDVSANTNRMIKEVNGSINGGGGGGAAAA